MEFQCETEDVCDLGNRSDPGCPGSVLDIADRAGRCSGEIGELLLSESIPAAGSTDIGADTLHPIHRASYPAEYCRKVGKWFKGYGRSFESAIYCRLVLRVGRRVVGDDTIGRILPIAAVVSPHRAFRRLFRAWVAVADRTRIVAARVTAR